MKYIYTTILAVILCIPTIAAQRPVRFNNETIDTVKLTESLIALERTYDHNLQKLVSTAGKMFLGTPYQSGTLESEPEMLSVNTEHLDCTTFVEVATAMAITIESHRSSWHDFVFNLEQLRYRGGAVNGYASRLHYISDWIIDNSHRGILQEVTDRIGNADYAVKTIDYMSTHRDLYPALKDSANYAGIKSMEIGYRSHRFPYIKTQNIKGAKIQEGDIIAVVSKDKSLDVSHIGIATLVNGTVHLMHASSKAGKVLVDPLPLQEYMRRNRSATGIRVIRLKD